MSGHDHAAAGQVDPDLAEPIDVFPPGSDRRLDRRSFVIRAMAAIGALMAAIVGLPVLGFASVPFFRAKTPARLLSDAVPPTLRSDVWVSAGALDDFDVGEPRLVPLQREVTDGWVNGVSDVAVYVVRETETEVVAFDIHCTHLGCPLAFASGSATFVCPCHGGSFDVHGDVTSGPPPRPMIQYETRVVDGDVQVGRIAPEA
jgi:quinol---cytochrome c reductase iron-sulfur subunit, bacillus type